MIRPTRQRCPAAGCDAEFTAVGEVIMCPRCWSRVPRALADAVQRTYRAWMDQVRTARSPEASAYQSARRAFDEASASAVDGVTGGLPARHCPPIRRPAGRPRP